MIKEICKHYGFDSVNMSRVTAGVGGLTYLVEADDTKYILKGVDSNDGYIQNEPHIAEFLKRQGIPVADYIKDNNGQYLWLCDGNQYHMQRFVEGEILPFNQAPDWLMADSAAMLGKIHTALSGYRQLPVGMGDGFINFVLSDHPRNSYAKTLAKAQETNDNEVSADVEYRLSLVDRLRNIAFDLSQFTCQNTHGDYKISQIICNDNQIAAVIDWTSACVHPVCWEIIRSFTYADPNCKDGSIDSNRLIEYIKTYLHYNPLNKYDLKMMPYFFYHQLLACDYYGQYYAATGMNKEDYLFQATFATKLIKWFEQHADDLSKMLCEII